MRTCCAGFIRDATIYDGAAVPSPMREWPLAGALPAELKPRSRGVRSGRDMSITAQPTPWPESSSGRGVG